MTYSPNVSSSISRGQYFQTTSITNLRSHFSGYSGQEIHENIMKPAGKIGKYDIVISSKWFSVNAGRYSNSEIAFLPSQFLSQFKSDDTESWVSGQIFFLESADPLGKNCQNPIKKGRFTSHFFIIFFPVLLWKSRIWNFFYENSHASLRWSQ